MWGVARAFGGRVLLRIEDHDRVRSRPAFEAALLEDLEWLGFAADEPPQRQSDRTRLYESAIARLAAEGRVYACSCSRRQIAAAAPGPDGTEPRYPGICRDRDLPLEGFVARRIRLPEDTARFVDLLRGPTEQAPHEQCGDLLAVDRDGNWTYQFAVTVDDFEQGVDLVIRGEDLLESTGRQLHLARLLGRAEPARFLHHPLLLRADGAKLSKSNRDSGIRELRAAGWSPEQVFGRAAHDGGVAPSAAPLTLTTFTERLLERWPRLSESL